MGEKLIAGEEECVPYLPSFQWYVRYFGAKQAGEGEADAIRTANSTLSFQGKEFTRSLVSRDVMLKVPVVGSSSAVKRLPPSALLISGHGDWRHTHIKTIDALFGRTPFFPHIMPGMEAAYSDFGIAGMRLAALTGRLHLHVSVFLNLDETAREWGRTDTELRATVTTTGKELSRLVKPEESMLSVAMRLGPDAIFPLIAALCP